MKILSAVAIAALLSAAGSPARAQSQIPQAWLFGTWTGGLFPVPQGMSTQACLAQPVVIFTRDVVMRATLTDPQYVQRVVETVRSSGNRTEFRFTPVPATGSGLLGMSAASTVGFGCEDPSSLHVQRRSDNEITFPGCADFPNPLVRCTSK